MDMCINDESFDGQFNSYEEAVEAITQLAALTTNDRFNQIRSNREILACKRLNERLLTKTHTVKEVIQRMVGCYDPKKKELNRQILSIFTKPYVKAYHPQSRKVEFNQQDVKQTALDAASVPFVTLALISIAHSTKFLDEEVNITVDDVDIQLLNFTSIDSVDKYHWQYKANDQKHLSNKAVKFGKNTASQMDLTGETAQRALSNSLSVTNNLNYYVSGNQWYAFRAESKGVYHGYCIDALNGDAQFNKAKKLFAELGDERVGQIFYDYVNWSQI